ncbi:transcription termination/antitermination protein NusG [Desertivirga brevis]|uniref:transcription termination/antitermination protein NusG n=1 Tax=Desertivirga brevis TaxID=2810310 RepID=UPI001A97378A|nr:UpxY family transcription antiterminator [Pedobacter sp. SYSU D00873]
MKTNWYAVYTKPRFEKKVADGLSAIGIENYCPLNKVLKQWSDRRKIVEEPLFTSYVFVRMNLKQHFAVRQVTGLINFVYWLGKPAVIHDSEIITIQDFLKEATNVHLEKTSIKTNDVVRITAGSFVNMEGHIVNVNKRTVKVELPSIGCALVAEVSREYVEVLGNMYAQPGSNAVFQSC